MVDGPEMAYRLPVITRRRKNDTYGLDMVFGLPVITRRRENVTYQKDTGGWFIRHEVDDVRFDLLK